MNDDPETRPNPFSASRIRPDAAAFLFPPGQNVEDLVERLRRSHWRGQIVGPHGSGKSTLLSAILSPSIVPGRTLFPSRCIAASGGCPGVPRRGPSELAAGPGHRRRRTTRPVEVGSGWAGRAAAWGSACSSRRIARSVLPDLCRTAVDPQLAWRVVEQLQAGFPPLVAFEDVAGGLARRGGDLRETLFELYDLYAERSG